MASFTNSERLQPFKFRKAASALMSMTLDCTAKQCNQSAPVFGARHNTDDPSYVIKFNKFFFRIAT